ncbi:hypothetical protein ABZ215_25160 [Amycolatopsis sp. NPDC006131]|uniref:hypothetical protein n=1 Tax=Amycolatopsis sp. NPDC006131 TaxID=3156731 RepID=UPI0033B67BE2
MSTVDTCVNCGKNIVFEPFFLDGKPGPNPPVWFHPPGARTCGVNPQGLVPWPSASPHGVIGVL